MQWMLPHRDFLPAERLGMQGALTHLCSVGDMMQGCPSGLTLAMLQ